MTTRQQVQDVIAFARAFVAEMESLYERLGEPPAANGKPPEGLGRRLLAVCRLAEEMRRAQRQYFQTRDGKKVGECKALEKKFDSELADVLEVAQGV